MVKRGNRGIVALVLRDGVENMKEYEVVLPSDVPTDLNVANKEQINLELIG